MLLTKTELLNIRRNYLEMSRRGRVVPVYDRITKRFDDLSKAQKLVKPGAIESDRIPTLMPPIGAGHEDEDNVLGRSDLPKSGEVINLYLRGNVLMADFGRVPLRMCKLIKGGVYDKVSCELWERPPGKFSGDGWMLKRVALLGADVPGVYTLEEIPDPEEGLGMVRGVEIFEVGEHNDIKYTLDNLKQIVRNYWLNRPSDEKTAELVRRYLKMDAKKPLGDGAATGQFKDGAVTVRIFRSLSKTYSVDTSTEGVSMTADQIRQALVAKGIFEQDEVNAMPDSAIMKMGKLCGIESDNADDEGTETEEKPKPKADAANADEKPVTDPEKKPDAANADAAGATPQAKMYMDQVISFKVAKQLEPLNKQLEKLTAQLAATSKTVDAGRRSSLDNEAVNFCDKLRDQKRLTFGMHSNAVEVYKLLSDSPAEVHFSDGGKKKKGSALDAFKALMASVPVIEDWDEKAGGPVGKTPDDLKTANHEKLKQAYVGFSSGFKKQWSLDRYIKSYDAAVETYGDDYSVEQHIAGV